MAILMSYPNLGSPILDSVKNTFPNKGMPSKVQCEELKPSAQCITRQATPFSRSTTWVVRPGQKASVRGVAIISPSVDPMQGTTETDPSEDSLTHAPARHPASGSTVVDGALNVAGVATDVVADTPRAPAAGVPEFHASVEVIEFQFVATTARTTIPTTNEMAIRSARFDGSDLL